MSRGVDQVQYIFFPIQGVIHLNGMAFNGDPPFTLQIHIVQNLRLQVFTLYGFGVFEQAIRQGAFAMVNMSNDTKIADIFHLPNFI